MMASLSNVALHSTKTVLYQQQCGPALYLTCSNVAGHVIGKGGETIAELRRTSGTNIMMSKNNEMFPGTQDRVSLITGAKVSQSISIYILEYNLI